MNAIPLARAWLCVNCSCVVAEPRCPACGSAVVMALGKWIKRLEEVAK